MSVNTHRAGASAVALAAVLAACGGGGGDSGHFSTADITTATGALMAALPAFQEAETDYLADNPPAVAARSSPPRNRWRPTLRPTIRAKRGAGSSATSAPMATSTYPCGDSGSTVYYDTTQQDVDSPYTNVLFNVDRQEDRDCTETYSDDTSTTTYTNDGWFEAGCPTDDPDCYVDYSMVGTPSSRARFHLANQDNSYGEFETTNSVYGVFHTQFDANYSRVDSYSYSEFDSDLSFVDNGQGGSGATFSYSYSGYAGTASNPWHVHDDQPGISVDGPYGLRSADFPECSLGEAAVETLVPMYVDANTYNVVGTVEVTADTRSAVVETYADGSADVTIDGITTTLTGDQVQAIKAGCPYVAAGSGN